ncbi:YbaN family protein [Devosia submarina]|uniref:YbaN family protein n=1 Tax=Devosia submarina TaxID=1173082 RepID=UPI002481C2D1|nr:YbaN family protein [Devosia submarina]
MIRALYLALGGLMLLLGALGAVLPLLPTTPFVLVALWLLSRSSKRAEAWMLNHHVVGPTLRAWRRERAISRKTKCGALASMALSYAVLLITTAPSLQVSATVAIMLFAAGGYVATRPSPAIIELPTR